MYYTTLKQIVTTKNGKWNCIKESAKLFLKTRYTNHKKHFNAEKNKNNTKLSREYWKLANKKLHPRISWIKKRQAYKKI